MAALGSIHVPLAWSASTLASHRDASPLVAKLEGAVTLCPAGERYRACHRRMAACGRSRIAGVPTRRPPRSSCKRPIWSARLSERPGSVPRLDPTRDQGPGFVIGGRNDRALRYSRQLAGGLQALSPGHGPRSQLMQHPHPAQRPLVGELRDDELHVGDQRRQPRARSRASSACAWRASQWSIAPRSRARWVGARRRSSRNRGRPRRTGTRPSLRSDWRAGPVGSRRAA